MFQNIDRAVLFPMADHLEYAVKRIQNHEQISNPLTDDIRVLFHLEYKTAECVRPILKERLGITIDDNEVGYISLHIHSAIKDENVSLAMQIARAVRECISHVEQVVNRPIDVMSLSYNRLMNHIRNMVARALQHEELKLNLNDYMEVKFPQAKVQKLDKYFRIGGVAYTPGYGLIRSGHAVGVVDALVTAGKLSTGASSTASLASSKYPCKGWTGEEVKRIQRALEAKGYSVGTAGVDGDFGSATDAAVRKFQRKYTLEKIL